ncbi:MAG: glycosyltransferase family 4 protein [Chlorobiales bacterium]|nr:glycosyltransferase family 4 protein [Chlorobiales bacterium]
MIKSLAKENRKNNLNHHFTIYLTKGQKFLIEKFLDEYFRVVEIPPASSSSAMKVFGEQVLLPFYLLFSNLDVVYYPGNFVPLLSVKPSVVAIRSMLYYHHPYAIDKSRLFVRKLLTPPSAKRSKAIITPSQDIKNDVINFVGIPEQKIHVINHGVDTELFQKNYKEEEREAIFKKFGITKKFIMYASALWRYKNQDKLIIAFEKLIREQNYDLQLVIAGQGINMFEEYQNELNQLVKDKGLKDRVLFTGLVPHNELKYLYKYAEVFAYPSSYESFGNPLFEAWASGVPIVCANVHSFPEMTQNGKCAVMVNPKDVDELNSALDRVLSDQDLRKKLIQNGAARVAEFSWEKCVRQTLEVITKTGTLK